MTKLTATIQLHNDGTWGWEVANDYIQGSQGGMSYDEAFAQCLRELIKFDNRHREIERELAEKITT